MQRLFSFKLYVVLGYLMGQERGWAPFKAGYTPPVAFATDRARAVIPSFPPDFGLYNVLVCLLHVVWYINMHSSLSSLFQIIVW